MDSEKKKKKHPILRFFGSMLLIALLFYGGFVMYKDYLLGKITYIPVGELVTFLDENGNEFSIEDATEQTNIELINNKDINNFLLIGIDSRDPDYSNAGKGSRSDVVMIMSVNSKEGTIKIISIARDSYVYVPGRTNPCKINAAMAYGGADLLEATLENTLRIEIDGYAFVNFANMAEIIDSVGGVYVDATKDEVEKDYGINFHLRALYGNDAPVLNTYGDHTLLNGKQAVAYSRIRYIGNGDYERSERQVEVLRSLLGRFMDLGVTGKLKAMESILSCVATNIQQDQIEYYALNFLPSLKNPQIQYMGLPIRDCFNGGIYSDYMNGEWSIRPNWNAMIPYVQQFFYDETKDFDPVPNIQGAPLLENCPKDIDIETLLK